MQMFVQWLRIVAGSPWLVTVLPPVLTVRQRRRKQLGLICRTSSWRCVRGRLPKRSVRIVTVWLGLQGPVSKANRARPCQSLASLALSMIVIHRGALSEKRHAWCSLRFRIQDSKIQGRIEFMHQHVSGAKVKDSGTPVRFSGRKVRNPGHTVRFPGRNCEVSGAAK